MDRLISEKAILDVIKEWFDEPISDECKTSKEMEEYTEKSLIKAIKAIPSAEPQKGYWLVDESDNSLTCTKCECTFYDNDITDGEANYCPNCGVKMEGMTWID